MTQRCHFWWPTLSDLQLPRLKQHLTCKISFFQFQVGNAGFDKCLLVQKVPMPCQDKMEEGGPCAQRNLYSQCKITVNKSRQKCLHRVLLLCNCKKEDFQWQQQSCNPLWSAVSGKLTIFLWQAVALGRKILDLAVVLISVHSEKPPHSSSLLSLSLPSRLLFSSLSYPSSLLSSLLSPQRLPPAQCMLVQS